MAEGPQTLIQAVEFFDATEIVLILRAAERAAVI